MTVGKTESTPTDSTTIPPNSRSVGADESKPVDGEYSYEIGTTSTKNVFRFVRNTCRAMDYDIVSDTLDSGTDGGSGDDTSTGAISIQKPRTELVQTRARSIPLSVQYSLGGLSVVSFVVGIWLGVLVLLVSGVLGGVVTLGLWLFDRAKFETVQYTDTIEISIEGRAVADGVEGTAGIEPSGERTSRVIVRAIVGTSNPKISTAEFRTDVETLHGLVLEFTNT